MILQEHVETRDSLYNRAKYCTHYLLLLLNLENNKAKRLRQKHTEEISLKCWTREGQGDLLQQRLGLPGGVFWLEVFVGFHFMLYGEQLSL